HLPQKLYTDWCEENNFESMLPTDRAAKKAAELQAHEQAIAKQSALTGHFPPAPPKPAEPVHIPWSQKRLEEALYAWMIDTNQPLQTCDRETFHEFVKRCQESPKPVKLPSRKQARKAILRRWDDFLHQMEQDLNVSSSV
ncbi:hypothetical protein SISNIDRAFT_396337, partial [Sistotremastrum niveocremeum HHB9708]